MVFGKKIYLAPAGLTIVRQEPFITEASLRDRGAACGR
jgi:hypothetical protein